MHKFNYFGQYEGKQIGPNGLPYDEDVELLEKEIDFVMRG
jgi:hypothetical protein